MGFCVTEAVLQSGADVIAIDRGDVPNHPSWGKPSCKKSSLSATELTHVELGDLQTLAKKLGRYLTYCPCDVSSLDATYAVFQKAVDEAPSPFRGLVNCAGIGWLGSSIDFPIEEARKIIDVNLVGTLICAQAAARLVQERNLSASFVFIASMSGYVVNKVSPSTAYTGLPTPLPLEPRPS